jgi:DNA-binding IclR family transcriptional regulator
VLGQYQHQAVTESQIAVLTGYKATTRYQTLKELKAAGLCARQGDDWAITPKGLEALGSDFEPLPTGVELRKYWLERLPKGERVMFANLVEAYPEPLTKAALQELSGYKGTTTYQMLKELRARQLITLDKHDAKAVDTLFS